VTRPRCVVFAYSEVGVRCLKALLSAQAEVALVVTHADDPAENRWYGSVAETAADYGLPAIWPAESSDAALLERVRALAPDFILSFYYRHLIPDSLLGCARRAALNMHGSLLPHYRGRAPVNWAVLHGETQTGATLHHMVSRADAGDIVGQQAVPILQDDDAREVFNKVVVAAEIVLCRAWPLLVAGTAPSLPQSIEAGSYFGRRRPEDGRIDWTRPARTVHDLVRAVAPPYPGAFTDLGGERVWIHRARVLDRSGPAGRPARLIGVGTRCLVECADGHDLQILAAATASGPMDLAAWATRLATSPLGLSA